MTRAPQHHRPSLLAIAGWVLTVPGFLMIAGVAADSVGLLEVAGCRFSFNNGDMTCGPGVVGSLMNVLQFFAVLTYFTVIMIVGAVPILWSLIYPVVRWRRRARA